MESFPRIRGVVPSGTQLEPIILRFSPRMRGCSPDVLAGRPWALLFPAYAGLFRRGCSSVSWIQWTFCSYSPRVRGCSRCADGLEKDAPLSPLMRGCSATRSQRQRGEHRLFPAYAGLFPTGAQATAITGSLSPRMRGCSPEGVRNGGT